MPFREEIRDDADDADGPEALRALSGYVGDNKVERRHSSPEYVTSAELIKRRSDDHWY